MSTLASVTAAAAGASTSFIAPLAQNPVKFESPTVALAVASSVVSASAPPPANTSSQSGSQSSGQGSGPSGGGYGADGSPNDDGSPQRNLVDVKI